MVSSNPTPTRNCRNKPLLLCFPFVTTSAVLALLMVSLLSSSSTCCDAKNTTTIGGRSGSNINSNSNINNNSKDRLTTDTIVGNIANTTNSTAAVTAIDNNKNIDIYHKLGVKPPHTATKVFTPPGLGIELPLARWSWKLHGTLLPLLHIFDGRPPDVFVNLRVLWCKLLSSLDPGSPAYEGEAPPRQQRKPKRQPGHTNNNKKTAFEDASKEGDEYPCESLQDNDHQQLYATYRMLPPYSIKWALRYLGLWRVFPRWMHANIELRTVYLQTALEKVLGSKQQLYNRMDGGGSSTSPGTNPASSGKIVAVDDDPNPDSLDSDNARGDDKNKSIERICVIILGGGYDSRGAKLSTTSYEYSSNSRSRARAIVQRVYELDLPVVVDSKRRLLLRAGFGVVDEDRGVGSSSCNDGNSCDQRNHASTVDFDKDRDRRVRLEGVDLNDDAAVDRVLDKIRLELIAIPGPNSYIAAAADTVPTNGKNQWRVVLISEAVLMYLDPGKAERILEGVVERFRAGSCKENRACFNDASFVFADRLIRRNNTTAPTRTTMTVPTTPDLIETEESEVRRWLRDRGWELDELLLKPGATRHLGIATAISFDVDN